MSEYLDKYDAEEFTVLEKLFQDIRFSSSGLWNMLPPQSWLIQPQKWKQQFPAKRWYLSAKLKVSQKDETTV
jgi:hypothetical protein